MKIETIRDEVSYFIPPIQNTVPIETVDLEKVYYFVKGGYLNRVTSLVREGNYKKKDVLPFITPSAVFSERKSSGLVSYSGIVSVDLDDVDVNLKYRIFYDQLIPPCFIFKSPLGKGLKLFYRIKDADYDQHGNYIDSLFVYLQQTFDLKADTACRDVTRACWLCYDPEALYSNQHIVIQEFLLKYFPQPEPINKPVQLVRNILDKYFERMTKKDHWGFSTESLMTRLNKAPIIHDQAERLLLNAGWTRNKQFWTRPGKDRRKGVSAIYNIYPQAGIWIFTVFTSSDSVFEPGEGYSDCQIIAKLGYQGDLKLCIDDLFNQFRKFI